MKTIRINLIFTLTFFASLPFVTAREFMSNPGGSPTANQIKSIMSGCANATQQIDLDINNVRAKILNGGDMWWDIFGSSSSAYQVPKVTNSDGTPGNGPHSQFASSVWVGGYDAGGQLKVAGQTYRQFGGNDYWPGPLSSNATIDAGTCLTWDKFWKVNRRDVTAYYDWVMAGKLGVNPLISNPSLPDAMDNINNWPATGPEGQALAPFYDINMDGVYNPEDGDVPDFDVNGKRGCAAQLYGDQCIYWVFNDKGNIKTESNTPGIGLEIQAQAFAFATTDDLNNATFLKYKIVNKSSFRLDSTFFGIWDDADLGWYKDDYVGCDVALGLGILYNGNPVDGSGEATSYGANPPAIGVDYFEGPYATPDGIDNVSNAANPVHPPSFLNYSNITIDDERLGLSKFVYFKNDATPQGNPSGGDDMYQYLTGTWKDGTPITYGALGFGGSIKCDYMFPGSSDQTQYWGTDGQVVPPWDQNSGADDMRFVESSGPFVLQPGAVNFITIGVPWARATQGGNLASVALLKGADAYAQLLFNNCFATLNGPTAPHVDKQELDKEIILAWTNPATSNNANEAYSEDYDMASSADIPYTFQGYLVYQLRDGSVSPAELHNVDKARLVFQCDKQDAWKQIINFRFDPTLQALVPTEMVNGENKGISHSISIKEDKFATGSNELVNHKTYYYAVIAYGHSPSLVVPDYSVTLDYKPYIEGRLNADYPSFHAYSAIPHIPSPEEGGSQANSVYGSGVKITRLEGQGNGGNVLDLTGPSVDRILALNRDPNPTYENGRGPINVKVIDPLNVPVSNKFRLIMYPDYPSTGVGAFVPQDSSIWDLVNLTTGDTVHSETTIKDPNEQIFNGQPINSAANVPKWGISINISLVYDPGNASAVNNSSLADASSISFSDQSKQWLTGLPDAEGASNNNWIRSGTQTFPAPDNGYNDIAGQDDAQDFEKVINGTWAPYRICAFTPTTVPNPLICIGGPAWGGFQSLTLIKQLASVDVIFTSDQSKWTRCPVLELQEEVSNAVGGAKKMNLRRALSVDKNGNMYDTTGYANHVPKWTIDSVPKSLDPNAPNYIRGDGMGWFPGYAINLETGERLNMAFGEDSWLASDNGRDMLWNPTSNKTSFPSGDPIFGGKHYIYVFGHNGNKKYTAADALLPDSLRDVPAYDKGLVVYNLLKSSAKPGLPVGTSDGYKREAYSDAMWVNIPLLVPGHSLLESDAKVRLRVTKSYQLYGTENSVNDSVKAIGQKYYGLNVGQTYFVENGPINDSLPPHLVRPIGSIFKAATTFYTSTITNPRVVTTTYKAAPTYEFNTDEIGTILNDADIAKSALDIINVVPNPYYAYSGYEHTAGDNVVKITNLPKNCTVSIYTLSGTLIRTLKKSDDYASMDWDLKNQRRIPVASGMYIIYIDVPGVGQKTLKWFGMMRPIDLDAY